MALACQELPARRRYKKGTVHEAVSAGPLVRSRSACTSAGNAYRQRVRGGDALYSGDSGLLCRGPAWGRATPAVSGEESNETVNGVRPARDRAAGGCQWSAGRLPGGLGGPLLSSPGRDRTSGDDPVPAGESSPGVSRMSEGAARGQWQAAPATPRDDAVRPAVGLTLCGTAEPRLDPCPISGEGDSIWGTGAISPIVGEIQLNALCIWKLHLI